MVGNPSPSQLVSPRRVVPTTVHTARSGVRGGAELRWALSYSYLRDNVDAELSEHIWQRMQ